MGKKTYEIIDFIEAILEKISDDSMDTEEILYDCISHMADDLKFIEASIYVIDKDKKNGYSIVNSGESKQTNIPFTVRARPEVLQYLEPQTKSVLVPVEGFDRGVYKFEEFVKILVPVDSRNSSFIYCELNKPTKDKITNAIKVSRILCGILREHIRKTEIYKLLYGGVKDKASEEKDSSIKKIERDETLSELAGSVAHLLNQPLTSLMGYVEFLIKQGKFAESELKYLNRIYNEAERLADVIRKIESVNSYATEDYLGSTKILKLDDLNIEMAPVKAQSKAKRISKKLSVFLEFYKAMSSSRSRGEIVHHYAFSINKMFPDLKIVMLAYKKDRGEFFLEYKEKGGFASDFELSEEKIEFYDKIMNDFSLKIYRLDDNVPHVITIPLVIEFEKMGIAEFDFAKEEISFFDLILLESMTEELVLSLYKLKLSEKNRYLKDYVSNLIENTSSLIFVLDENHEIRTCNPAFVEAMKLPKSDLEGEMLIGFIPDKSEKLDVKSAIDECFSGKVVRKIDSRLTTGSEDAIDTRFSLIPLPKVKNLRPEIIAIGQNITEVKQLENQVMQSEKLAYLGQMAACVAHELNNPLTSITVFTEYLLKKLGTDIPENFDAYKDKLERIYESTNRIHSFTKNLTSFAKPPDDGLMPEKLNINAIIREAILFADYEINKGSIKVDCKLDDEIPDVEGFKSQLHQIFINLIGNASHALEEKGGNIIITTKDHDPDFVEIDVSDNGQGIDSTILEKIFEPFISTRKGEGGTGLGLTIVKRIIDNHKGRIEVKSEIGKGTTFSMFLRKQM